MSSSLKIIFSEELFYKIIFSLSGKLSLFRWRTGASTDIVEYEWMRLLARLSFARILSKKIDLALLFAILT